MKTEKYYIYKWNSGLKIEEEYCKINKIKNGKIYFYNDYCNEHQQANVKDCKKKFIKNGYYICNYLQN